VIRPADANETVAAWREALENGAGPTALILSRQKLPVMGESVRKNARLDQGAYVVSDGPGEPELILMASGSEVSLAEEAAGRLRGEKISVRVVNLPSWELFEKTEKDARDAILPPKVSSRLAVEAGVAMGWERYVGDGGDVMAMSGFGASAPGGVVMEHFGFTVENVCARARALIGR
jgi:transketolase